MWTQGEVQAVDPKGRILSVAHHPIPEWQWPAMEMDFGVADNVDMTPLAPGQTLHIQMEQEGDDYRIINIHIDKQAEKAAPPVEKPAAPKAEMKDMKGMEGMEGMDHSQHQMGDKP